MIYVDASAVLKFVKPERESDVLRSWRRRQPRGTKFVTSNIFEVEISRTLLRAGMDQQRVPYMTEQALLGLYLVEVTSAVLKRARSYGIRELGSLDAIHLSSAHPFAIELTDFITYDRELAAAAHEVEFPTSTPA